MSSLSPAVIIYNADGTVALTVTHGAAYGVGAQALPVAGRDGSGNAQFLRTHTDGTVKVDPTGTTAQPVTGPLTDAQLRATAVPVSDGGGSLTVDGTVTANAGSGPWPVTDNGGSLTVDGTVSVSGTVPVSGPLTNTELRASAVPVSGTFFQATQPVSAASLPLPAGAATAALQTQPGVDIGDVTVNNAPGAAAVNIQDGGNSITVDGTVAVSGSVAVTGPLTDAQLRATPVPVSGTVTANAGTGPWPVTDNGGSLTVDGTVGVSGSVAVTGPLTDAQLRAAAVPVSVASLPLPVGAATETTISAINTKTPALGQAAMAASSPVVIANNQTVIPVNDNGGSLTVDGSVAVSNFPAVQSVNDNGGSLTVDGTVTANAGTGPWPVTDNGGSLTVDGPLTDAQLRASAVPVSAATLPLPAGAATEATLATRLAETTFTARINTLGQKAAAASTPVVLPTDQSAISVTTTGGEEATYTVIASAATLSNNKSLLSIYNPTGSGYVLKLREFYLRNSQTTAVTGVAARLELFRFVSAGAPTGGTAITPISHDSADATPAGMDARTGGTVSGELAAPLDRIRMSTDEWGPGTADVESQQQSIANYLPARAKRDGLLKPFYARAGEGLHMKFATNSTAGSLDVIFVFTKV